MVYPVNRSAPSIQGIQAYPSISQVPHKVDMEIIAVPAKISLVATLPKTRSGKIMRRVLKARALGLPEGDISTLEA